MNWYSEAAVLWIPTAGKAYPSDFADRAFPGTSDFYYLALDAFAAIERLRPANTGREPWIFLLDGQIILPPAEIERLWAEWGEQMRTQSRSRLSPKESYALASALETERDA